MESTAERTGKGRQRVINMNWHLEKKVRNNPAARKAFNELAIQVFQLSFESWYENGYWTDAYIPYTYGRGYSRCQYFRKHNENNLERANKKLYPAWYGNDSPVLPEAGAVTLSDGGNKERLGRAL